MKKLVSLFLAIIMCVAVAIPVHAQEPQFTNMMATSDTVDTQQREPSVPDGFTFWYEMERDVDVEAKIIDGGVVLFAFVPYAGLTASIIGAIRFIEACMRDPNVLGTRTHYVYQADNPVVEYGVPYVYWHKVKLQYLADGVVEERWTSYYEYAVAPR